MNRIMICLLLGLSLNAFAESYDECTTKCNDNNACLVNNCQNLTGAAVIACHGKCEQVKSQCYNVTCAGKATTEGLKSWNLGRSDPMFVETLKP